MPYFAADDRISEASFDGAIEITKEQYQNAFDAMMQGNRVIVRGGDLRILRAEQRTVYGNDGARLRISVDDDVPEGYSEEKPPSPRHEWDGSAWVLDDAIKAEIEAEEARAALAATDADMAQVAEDIIGLLIGKGVFTAEEMPESVRDKIQEREALRALVLAKGGEHQRVAAASTGITGKAGILEKLFKTRQA